MFEWLKKVFDREIYIPAEARICKKEFNGHAVKDAFYTAPYGCPLNHTDTYVVEGSQLGVDSELLVRTGNMIMGLPPEVLRIMQTADEGGQIKYTARPVSRRDERNVLEALGVLDD